MRLNPFFTAVTFLTCSEYEILVVRIPEIMNELNCYFHHFFSAFREFREYEYREIDKKRT